MKVILISIKPRFVVKILKGEKTIEVRKGTALYKATQKLIDEYGFAEFYVHCTKDNKHELYKHSEAVGYCADDLWKGLHHQPCCPEILNGKVAFKFRCYKAAPVVMQKGAETGYGNNGYVGYGHCEQGNFKFLFDMEKETCLEHNEELCKYLNNGKNFDDIYINKLKAKDGCAIHISDLEIFDRPKELCEYYNLVEETIRPDCPLKCKWWCITNYDCKYYVEDDCYGGQLACACPTKKVITKKPLTKAPPSWCYIETEELL